MKEQKYMNWEVFEPKEQKEYSTASRLGKRLPERGSEHPRSSRGQDRLVLKIYRLCLRSVGLGARKGGDVEVFSRLLISNAKLVAASSMAGFRDLKSFKERSP